MVVAETSRPLASGEVFLPLTQASNLPGKYLYDEEIYREECQRIFYRNWLCVGRAEDIREVGSFMLKESEMRV